MTAHLLQSLGLLTRNVSPFANRPRRFQYPVFAIINLNDLNDNFCT